MTPRPAILAALLAASAPLALPPWVHEVAAHLARPSRPAAPPVHLDAWGLRVWASGPGGAGPAGDAALPLRADPRVVQSRLTLHPSRTVLVVMDPWRPSGVPEIDGPAIAAMPRVVDAMRWARDAGIAVAVATHPPGPRHVPLHPSVRAVVDEGGVEVWTHDTPSSTLRTRLALRGVDTIVWAGFDAAMCVLSRPSGIYRLGEGYRRVVLEDATAAADPWPGVAPEDAHRAALRVMASSGVWVATWRRFGMKSPQNPAGEVRDVRG